MNWPPQWKVLWLGVLVSFQVWPLPPVDCPTALTKKTICFRSEDDRRRAFDKCPRLSSMLPCKQTAGRISLCRNEIRGRSASSNGGKLLAPGSNSFEEWLQENPNDSEGDFARLQLGKIHFRFDRPQVAEETLSPILPSSRLYGPARSLIGKHYSRECCATKRKTHPPKLGI